MRKISGSHSQNRARALAVGRAGKIAAYGAANAAMHPGRAGVQQHSDDRLAANRRRAGSQLDRLRHGAYGIVIKGESFRKPKPMPENGENAVAKSGEKTHS